jgi:hypothetical protein
MSPRGSRQKPTAHKVEPRHVSPDDIKFRMLEAEQQRALDTRTPAPVWLGDPPPTLSGIGDEKKHSAGDQCLCRAVDVYEKQAARIAVLAFSFEPFEGDTLDRDIVYRLLADLNCFEAMLSQKRF